MKTIFSILTLLLLPFVPNAQQLEEYVQDLPGTELEIPMAAIPGGSFTMGSPKTESGRNQDEGPMRKMELEGFWMSKYEVTWDLYKLFLQRSLDGQAHEKGKEVDLDVDAVSSATVPYVDMSLGMGTGEGLPVGNVTFKAAQQFCKWLSALTGHFYRLPTEAEWEDAARAGSEDADFFGNDPKELEAYAWYASNSGNSYQIVGQKLPNPHGLHDIYGNVSEWCMDQYGPEGYPTEGKAFEAVTKEYPIVVRGGSFKDGPEALRSASRLGSHPNWKVRDPQFPRSQWWFTDAGFVGFRVVRPLQAPSPEAYSLYWGQE